MEFHLKSTFGNSPLTKKQKQNLTVLGIICLISLPYIAGARGLVPCGGEGEVPCNIEHVFIILARVTNWLLMVAGVFASYKIIQGGFWLIVAMGNEEDITKNRKLITNAVVGFVFTLLAFLFVSFTLNLFLRQATGPNESKCKIDIRDPMSFLLINDQCGKY